MYLPCVQHAKLQIYSQECYKYFAFELEGTDLSYPAAIAVRKKIGHPDIYWYTLISIHVPKILVHKGTGIYANYRCD